MPFSARLTQIRGAKKRDAAFIFFRCVYSSTKHRFPQREISKKSSKTALFLSFCMNHFVDVNNMLIKNKAETLIADFGSAVKQNSYSQSMRPRLSR